VFDTKVEGSNIAPQDAKPIFCIIRINLQQQAPCFYTLLESGRERRIARPRGIWSGKGTVLTFAANIPLDFEWISQELMEWFAQFANTVPQQVKFISS